MKNHTKYLFLLLLTAVFMLCGGVTASAASEQPAEGEAESVVLSICDGSSNYPYFELLDNLTYTNYHISSERSFIITGNQPFTSLYLIFTDSCQWEVTLPDGTTLDGGQNGFIHEYMSLGQAVDRVTLRLTEDTTICDVMAFTDGALPDWVQVWQPPCEKADLLVMPTHGDDEHLWFGGAMPYYAGELGYEVQVVYLTNHNNHPTRHHEMLNGLWKVGVTHYPIITDKFLDVYATKYSLETAEEIFGYDNVLAFQVETLRRFAPRVIIAHDINGEYGHGAHKLNAKTLLEALELTDDPSAFPDSARQYGTCKVQKCYLHLWPEHTIVMDWGSMPLQHFGGKTALQMAKEGFACHRTQQYPRLGVYESGNNDCRLFGLAYTTVGYDTEGKNDMFEHVDWSGGTDDAYDAVSVSDSSGDAVETDAARQSAPRRLPAAALPVTVVVLMAASAIVAVVCVKKRK